MGQVMVCPIYPPVLFYEKFPETVSQKCGNLV